MNLYILRHAIAVERGTPGFADDAERPITTEGKRKTKQAGAAMKEMKLSFDLILSSPYQRARQTAEIVARKLKAQKRLEFSDSLTPSGNQRKLIEQLNALRPRPDAVLLVGHEPYLSELISLLVSGDDSLCIVLKKGGLCRLSIDSLKYGPCAALEWLLTPKQLALVK